MPPILRAEFSMHDASPLTGKTLFVGVGAQKAGTSWLYSYLNRHPQVSMSRIKELHYFDAKYRPDISGMYDKKFRQSYSEFLLRPDWDSGAVRQNLVRAQAILDRLAMGAGEITYLDYFASRVKPQHSVFGEITPSYSILDEVGMRAIRDAQDDVRVIFLMRDPVDRLWSALRHSGVRTDDPRETISDQIQRPHHRLRSDYAAAVTTLDKVFPKDRVLHMFYEGLFTDESIGVICGFLGIDPEPADFSQRVNVGRASAMPDVFVELAEKELVATYRFCRQRFGDAVPGSWRPLGLTAE